MREFYPAIEPYAHEMLKVSDTHSLYVEQCGNPKGLPVIFLHGGPGAGCSPLHRRFFDPKKWRVILFDQRGAGRSKPLSDLSNNTTWDLVDDIERIRTHLGIDKWAVFGGSWGSTLALSYSQAHPERVRALILRGIFLFRQKEIDWFYGEGGTSALFPDLFEEYRVPVAHVTPDQFVREYYRILTGSDKAARKRAAKAWTDWESRTVNLLRQPDDTSSEERIDSFARIEAHYMFHRGFLRNEWQLLEGVDRIRHIPAVIVHGRYDVICPLQTAYDLHKAWPEAALEVVDGAGHSAFEDGIRSKLIEYVDKFAKLLGT